MVFMTTLGSCARGIVVRIGNVIENAVWNHRCSGKRQLIMHVMRGAALTNESILLRHFYTMRMTPQDLTPRSRKSSDVSKIVPGTQQCGLMAHSSIPK